MYISSFFAGGLERKVSLINDDKTSHFQYSGWAIVHKKKKNLKIKEGSGETMNIPNDILLFPWSLVFSCMYAWITQPEY